MSSFFEIRGKLRVTFRSLRYRNCRLFFIGQCFSLTGTWMQSTAMSWLVYRLTHSLFLLGMVGFINSIPTFFLTPFAGVFADKYNRRHILIITASLATLQAFALACLFFMNKIAVWHIVGLGIVLGFASAFEMPARQSFIVEIVEKKEDLGNAIALNSTIFNSARLVGPVLAGILVSIAGEGICFLLNGISYFFIIGALLSIKTSFKKVVVKQGSNVLRELKEGIVYAFNFTPIISILLLLALVSLMGMSYGVLMPAIAKNVLKGGPHTLGFLMGSCGVGALISAIYLASRKSVLGLEKIIAYSTILLGIGLIMLSLSRIFTLSLIIMAIIGLGMVSHTTSCNTILQTIVDDDKRGRIMSLFTISFVGLFPFSNLLAGSLADKIGISNTLFIAGVSCILGASLFASKIHLLTKVITLKINDSN